MLTPNDLIQIQDDYAWRLIDVKRIFRYRDGFHDLSAYFQRVDNADELIYNLENNVTGESNIKSFAPRISVEYTLNVEFVRCLVIGSIWWKDRYPILPNYFGEFQMEDNFLDYSKEPKHYRINKYIASGFIPKHDKTSLSYTERSDISVYELNRPIEFFPLNEVKTEFSTKDNGSSAKRADFIAFHNYEIYRYFLSAKGEGTLNQRFLTSEIIEDRKSTNHVFDPVRTRQEQIDGTTSNLVYLKEYGDKRNTELIGNAAFLPEFKSKMIYVRNQVLNSAGRTFGDQISLPISSFEKMVVCAKWVQRRSDIESEEGEVWGLLVFQIKECRGYNDLEYTPVVSEHEVNPGGQPIVKTKIRNNKKKNEGKDYFDNHTGGDPAGETVDLPSNELFELVNPSVETTIKRTKVEISDSDGTPKLITEKELKDRKKIAGPKIFNGDDDQLTTEIKKEVDPIDYFVFFNVILQKLKVVLEAEGLETKIECLNDDLQFVDHMNPVHYSMIKSKIGAKVDTVVRCFVAQLQVGGHYFYFLEKERERTSGQDRSWLLALPSFRGITNEEIPGILMGYLFISRKSERAALTYPDGEFMIDAGLNHLHVRSDSEIARLKKANPNEEVNVKLTKEEAINRFVKKTTKNILKVI